MNDLSQYFIRIKIMIKNKILIIVLLFFGFSAILLDTTLIVNKNIDDTNIEYIVGQKYFRLLDSYDGQNENIFDFFNKKDSLLVMENTSNEIWNKKELDYYYFDNQNLEYLGDYYKVFGKNTNFVTEKDTTCINQPLENNAQITPLNAIQIDNKIFTKSNLVKLLKEDNCLKENYMLDDTLNLPVILGNDYKEIFKVGDSFTGCYLGENNVTFYVVGILEDDKLIEKNSMLEIIYDLTGFDSINNYIIIPNCSLNLINEEHSMFNKIISCQKCSGFLTIDSKEDLYFKINILKDISNETNFKYSINLGNPIYEQMNFKFKYLIISLIFFIILILIIVIYVINIEKKRLMLDKLSINEWLNTLLNYGVIVSVIYGGAYFIDANIVLVKYRNGISQIALIYFGIIILFFIICLILGIVLNVFNRKEFNISK